MTQVRDIHSKIRRRVSHIRRCVARRRADESGLTTLEWLLIVAAVAGLAALAVVLVTNVVDDTSEQISGSSARVTAARVAAQAVVDDSNRDASAQPTGAKTWGEWEQHYKSKCDRIEITYGDAGVESTPNFDTDLTDSDDVLATNIETPAFADDNGDGDDDDTDGNGQVDEDELTDADSGKAVAQCVVTSS